MRRGCGRSLAGNCPEHRTPAAVRQRLRKRARSNFRATIRKCGLWNSRLLRRLRRDTDPQEVSARKVSTQIGFPALAVAVPRGNWTRRETAEGEFVSSEPPSKSESEL